jgi:hypothetical protein
MAQEINQNNDSNANSGIDSMVLNQEEQESAVTNIRINTVDQKQTTEIVEAKTPTEVLAERGISSDYASQLIQYGLTDEDLVFMTEKAKKFYEQDNTHPPVNATPDDILDYNTQQIQKFAQHVKKEYGALIKQGIPLEDIIQICEIKDSMSVNICKEEIPPIELFAKIYLALDKNIIEFASLMDLVENISDYTENANDEEGYVIAQRLEMEIFEPRFESLNQKINSVFNTYIQMGKDIDLTREFFENAYSANTTIEDNYE